MHRLHQQDNFSEARDTRVGPDEAKLQGAEAKMSVHRDMRSGHGLVVGCMWERMFVPTSYAGRRFMVLLKRLFLKGETIVPHAAAEGKWKDIGFLYSQRLFL